MQENWGKYLEKLQTNCREKFREKLQWKSTKISIKHSRNIQFTQKFRKAFQNKFNKNFLEYLHQWFQGPNQLQYTPIVVRCFYSKSNEASQNPDSLDWNWIIQCPKLQEIKAVAIGSRELYTKFNIFGHVRLEINVGFGEKLRIFCMSLPEMPEISLPSY